MRNPIVEPIETVNERLRDDELLADVHLQAAALESVNDGVVICQISDSAFSIVYSNPAFQSMSGYSAAEILGRSCGFLRGPDTDAGVQQQICTALETGNVFLGEILNYRKDGTSFWDLVRISWLRNGAGQISHCVSLHTDITDLKRTQQRLEDNEYRFHNIANAAPAMLWMTDPDNSCIFCNEKWLSFKGTVMGQELEDGWLEGMHQDDIERSYNIFTEASKARRDFVMEYRMRRYDGEYRWLLDQGTTRYGPDGVFRGYIGSCVDITDRKLAEDALRRAESDLRYILETTPAIPWEADANTWRFTYVGPQAEQVFGYPLEKWYEPSFWAEQIYLEDREWVLDFCEQSSKVSSHYEFQYRMIAADGSVVWVQDIVSVESANNKPVRFRGFLMDITKSKRQEKETQELRETLAHLTRVTTVAQLGASIAHELNQPLAAIIGNAQAASRFMDQNNLDEVREALADIASDGHRAGDIIERVRGLVRKKTSVREKLDINELLRAGAGLLRSELVNHEVQVTWDLGSDLPAIDGDVVQVQQLLINLMTNAIDAMADREPTSRLLTLGTRSEVDGNAICVSVQDSGPGADDQNLQKMFETFYSTKEQGTGMGLLVCRSIVEAYGGRLWVERNADYGLTFYFTLPVDPDYKA